jgi:hypothetical protein
MKILKMLVFKLLKSALRINTNPTTVNVKQVLSSRQVVV